MVWGIISYEEGFNTLLWLEETVDHEYYIKRVLDCHIIPNKGYKNKNKHHPEYYFQ